MFDYNKSKNIFEDNFEIIEDFDYDILYLIEKDFTSLDLMEKETVKISFSISEKKRQEIDEYIKIFGNTDNGISRILSRIYLKTYFREAQIVK